MPGSKYFTNDTPYILQVSLVVREGEDPREFAEPKDFSLNPEQSQWVEYGNDTNIYLSGIQITAVVHGSAVLQRHIVIQRSSPLDDKLNTRNGVTFTYNPDTSSLGIYTKEVRI
ncbi:hypothetical protein [Pseudoalteromonas sp. McH1-42]|uniref:hypothetical protein n=1 Tax=Pseudoalteromonas sp. McH1-42 TaxID=2917752 RepID=UPI001EF4D720|nr:hypothetical protein [Pseudoalteromonas sp. McH1-42]MCG7564652.1 hypothetical protein [Pseudoalteromonas sp. McH1-42]